MSRKMVQIGQPTVAQGVGPTAPLSNDAVGLTPTTYSAATVSALAEADGLIAHGPALKTHQ
jgi:hypothetical protein